MKKLNRVYQKIENDYQEFKNTMLAQNPNVIFDRAYKIFCVNEIYAVLKDSYEFTVEDISAILDFKGNILEQIYDEWLHNDYTHQDVFYDTIFNTFSSLCVNKAKPSIHVPDGSVSVDEMINYGYSWEGMLPLRADKAKKLMKRCTVYQLYRNNTEGVVTTINSLMSHAKRGGIFGVDRKEWEILCSK